ncbi:MAG: hypothetical protein Kow0063_08090 [Anaerolineae bacterium]
MINRTLVVAVLVAVCILVTACSSTSNYTDALEPRFTGRYSDQTADFDGTLQVVSYNVSFGENVDRVIYELSEFDELKGADIVLLQEMDEIGTESIARTLGYNYVYFPASIHSHHDKNFGNAILSKWPIHAPEKIILPYKSPTNQQIRIAVKALISVGDLEILTYSVHTETFWLGRQKRHGQIDALIESIEPDSPYVVVGGDFNTLTPKSIEYLEESLGEIGMARASQNGEPTLPYAPFEFTLDHIFVRGMDVNEAGVSEEATASDHFPIWVRLTPLDQDTGGVFLSGEINECSVYLLKRR